MEEFTPLREKPGYLFNTISGLIFGGIIYLNTDVISLSLLIGALVYTTLINADKLSILEDTQKKNHLTLDTKIDLHQRAMYKLIKERLS